MSAAQDLAADVLFLILSYLTARELILVTHVCRHWRQSAIEIPLLWTNISDFHNKSRVAIFLKRAMSASVDFRRVPVDSDDDILLDIISRHLHHTRTLEILLQGLDPIGCKSHGLRLFQTPAPLLEELTVDGSALHRFFKVIVVPNWAESRIFGGSAPCLHSVSVLQISNVRGLLARLPQPEAVRDIHIDYGKGTAQRNIDTVIAAIFPNALNLYVNHSGWRIDEGVGHNALWLGSLRTLHLRTDDQNVVNEFNYAPMLYAWSKLSVVSLDISGGVCKDRMFSIRIPICGDEPYKSIEVISRRSEGEWERDLLCIRAVTPSGRVRILNGFHPNHLESLLRTPEAERKLEELRLDATGYRVASMLHGVTLLALRVLCLVAGESVAALDLGRRWTANADFENFIQGIEDSVFITPNLDALEFESVGPPLTVPDTTTVDLNQNLWSIAAVVSSLQSFSLIQAGSKVPVIVLRGFKPQIGQVEMLMASFAVRVIVAES